MTAGLNWKSGLETYSQLKPHKKKGDGTAARAAVLTVRMKKPIFGSIMLLCVLLLSGCSISFSDGISSSGENAEETSLPAGAVEQSGGREIEMQDITLRLPDGYHYGISEMENGKVYYVWNTEYKDGVANYQYTEPFQKSQSLEIDPTFFDFETITSEAILEEEASGNEIHFIVSGKKISETGISAIQQISGIENLNCGDVEVTVTLSDSGCIHQLLMNFDASVKYQGYDADVAYKVQYNFS